MSRPAIARIHLGHLCHNYNLLRQRAGQSSVMAVVKANAYGHGLDLVAPALAAEGCRDFAVTDAREGRALRQLISDASITLLSGIFDSEDATIAREHDLTPTVSTPVQVRLLADANFGGGAWVKLDTGMHRLGAEAAEELIGLCRTSGIGITGLMSHLACADEPDHAQNMTQAENFLNFRRRLGIDLPTSLLNSAGMITLADVAGDVVRPGIALYGAEPIPTLPIGLKPVMQLTGRIMQIRDLEAGTPLSYGASYITPHRMKIATVSLGYADGLPRHLSNLGHGMLHGRNAPIVGRVCMDYVLVDVSDISAATGDDVEFWGSSRLANDVADSIGTISYTLFTGVGQRVQRVPIR